MLTKITIRNFKRFEEAVIDLDNSVVFIGPNNSGKTTALQALTLWDTGLRQWLTKRGNSENRKGTPEKRPGVSLNRRDLISIPIPYANLLWRDTHTRIVSHESGKQKTQNIRIDILVEGITKNKEWECGLEFDYANEESIYCRPLRLLDGKNQERMRIPELAAQCQIAYLPLMSGLAEREFAKQEGEIGVLIGQGQTAQVLRNLCYNIHIKEGRLWEELIRNLKDLFGIELLAPKYFPQQSEITMSYKEPHGEVLDISSSGRGVQQTLLLFTHLYANPGSVLLFDEPDAHLEILRQRQTYNFIVDIANNMESQIIAASHSEIVLNEAADKGQVIAFVGKPHKLTDKGSQVLKALRDIGFDQYYQAEQKGWVLYLEDATDLSILQELALKLNHPAHEFLQRPFVHYISCDIPAKARDHFYGLQAGKEDLVGVAIFDRIDKSLNKKGPLREMMWTKREIENYICNKDVLLEFAKSLKVDVGPLFDQSEEGLHTTRAMEESISDMEKALKTLGKEPWSDDIKASDEFLDPLFKNYSSRLDIPLIIRKREYYQLVKFAQENTFDKEVTDKLNVILEVAQRVEQDNL